MSTSKKIDQMRGQNPFKVPEGYFERFNEELMKKLPAKEEEILPEPPATLWMRVRPWLYMAAMFCGILLMGQVVFHATETEPAAEMAVTAGYEEEFSDEFIESVIDNTLIDDYTVYCYLTQAE